MDRSDILNRIAAIILAIGLWIYVTSVVNPPTTVTIRQVPVQLLNADYLENARLAIAGDGFYTVDVSLSGKRKDLLLTADNLTATADLQGLAPGQNYITVRVISPGNTTVSEIRTEKIQVYVDELVSEEKPVEVVVSELRPGTEFSTISLDYETMIVSGAKSLVELVDRVTIFLDGEELEVDEPISVRLAASPVDVEGNPVKAVRLESDYIAADATLYTVKSVPLYTSVEGTPGLGAKLIGSSIPSTVSIKGTLFSLAKINYIDAQPLDIEGIIESSEQLVVPILPEGVELSKDNGSMIATFTLSETGSLSFERGSADVLLEGLDETLLAQTGEAFTIEVTVTAPIADIPDFDPQTVVLFADLSQIEEAGEFDVPIQGRTEEGEEADIATEPQAIRVVITAAEPADEE